MTLMHNPRFGHQMMVIHPGEFFCTDRYIVQTVLGTCISVILHSDCHKAGGMNHFMLPGTKSGIDMYHSDAGRYGQTAMDKMINSLMKKDIYKKDLKAKVFGGGRMFMNQGKNVLQTMDIGTRNFEFIFQYLEAEKIPVTAQDVGGEGGRKVLYFPWDGRVFVSRMKKTDLAAVSSEEMTHAKKIQEKIEKPKPVIF